MVQEKRRTGPEARDPCGDARHHEEPVCRCARMVRGPKARRVPASAAGVERLQSAQQQESAARIQTLKRLAAYHNTLAFAGRESIAERKAGFGMIDRPFTHEAKPYRIAFLLPLDVRLHGVAVSCRIAAYSSRARQ